MKTVLISTKEIRNDLQGFLQRLKEGQTFQVVHRSKPIVTIAATEENGEYLAANAGTPAAGRHSVDFVRGLPKHEPAFDRHKSFKELYEESR